MSRGGNEEPATVLRPTTAKLPRPQIMDPSWSLNIDMTTIKLSTLEEVEAVLTKPRRHHLQATVAAATKKRADHRGAGRRTVSRPLNATAPIKRIAVANVPSAVDIHSQEMTGHVPSPCMTCTKNDEPERFHSHPRTAHMNRRVNSMMESHTSSPSSTVRAGVETSAGSIFVESPTRKAITKPVPLKFRSGKTKDNNNNNKMLKVQIETKNSTPHPPTSSISTVKRFPARLVVSKVLLPVNLKMAYDHALLYCKKCGKTFGNDEELLRLHVESCEVVWTDLDSELENESSGSGPASGIADDQYEQYKEKLMPCLICGRKFHPNRIETHEAACRKVKHTSRSK